ncbi:MAG: hypothetical protein ACREI8_14855, partial [Myxococcota bacterium]
MAQVPGLPSASILGVPITASGTSTGVLVNASVSIPAFEFSTVVLTGGNNPINVFARLTLNGVVNLTAAPSMASADSGIPGSLSVRVASMTKLGGFTPRTTIVKVPLEIGGSGTHKQTFFFLGSYHYLTADFYAWTPHTRTFTGLTLAGAPLPDAVGMGSFALTPNGAGTVTLVAPTRIQISSALGPIPRTMVSFDTLTLHFAPEPKSVLLLAAAALALARARRSSPQ